MAKEKQLGVFLDLASIKQFCIVCGSQLPMARIMRRAVTCEKTESKNCKLMLKKMRRAISDTRQCRMCHRPSTPEQRRNWQRWSREDRIYADRVKKPRSKPVHPVQSAP